MQIRALDGMTDNKSIANGTAINGNNGEASVSVFNDEKPQSSQSNKNNDAGNDTIPATLTAEQVTSFDTKNRSVDGEKQEIKIAPDGNAYILNQTSGKYELLTKVKSGNIFHKAQYARTSKTNQAEQNESKVPDDVMANENSNAAADTNSATSQTQSSSATGQNQNLVTSVEPGENASESFKDVYNSWMSMDDESFNKAMESTRQTTGNKNDYNFYSHTISAADLKKIYANADRAFLNDFFGEENMRNMTGDDTSTLEKADDTKFLLTYQAISAERTGTPMQVDINNGTIRMLDNRLL